MKRKKLTAEELAERDAFTQRVRARIREREALEERWQRAQESGSTESPTRTTPDSSTSA